MAKDARFNEARRRLDEALQQLDGEAPQGAEGEGPEEAEGQPPAGPGKGAPGTRVAPRRRGGAGALRATGRTPTTDAQGAADGPTAPGLPGAYTVRLDTPEGAELSETPQASGGDVPPQARRPAAEAPRAAPAEVDALASAEARAPTSEALVRLMVGAALLGLDGLAARADDWEAAAGMAPRRQAPAAREGEIGSGRFRHALVGWIFEAEEQLRPRGNPISWLRAVVAYVFGTVFSVVLDLLPLPRLGRRRGPGALAEPTAEDTRRWVRRGQAEEAQSRRFARAAIEHMLDSAIVYLARRPAVGRALGELVRSPAMDDAVRQIAASPAIEDAVAHIAQSPALDTIIARVAQSPALDQAVSQIARSPALEEAVGHIVRSPAMEEAVKYLVSTKAMSEAIDTLAQSPALVDLVTTQSTSVAVEILEEVRERGVSADKLAEGIMRRLLRRPPRSTLPLEAQGLLVAEVPPEQEQ